MVQWIPLINPNKPSFCNAQIFAPGGRSFAENPQRPSWVGKPKRAAEGFEVGRMHKLTIIRNWWAQFIVDVKICWRKSWIYIYIQHIHISTDWCLIPLMWENFANGIMSIQMSHFSHEKVTPWNGTISSINSRDSKFSSNESRAANWPFL